MTQSPTTGRATAAAMREAALALLAALGPEQHAAATAPFETPDHREWTYLPGPRAGLSLREMDDAQRELAMRLLATGLSERGLATARDVMALEEVLGDLEREVGETGLGAPTPAALLVRVLGTPDAREPWAWRVNGHHLAVHLTLVGDEVAGTPQFFGANPAVVPRGPHQGLRTLPLEEDLARELLARSTPVSGRSPSPTRWRRRTSRRGATRSPTRAGPARSVRRRHGRRAAHGADGPRPALRRTGRVRRRSAGAAGDRRAGALGPGVRVAGGLEPGTAHYYAVTHPTFLLEYDNAQDGANHAHAVWRDLRRDWGADLLAAHHAGRL